MNHGAELWKSYFSAFSSGLDAHDGDSIAPLQSSQRIYSIRKRGKTKPYYGSVQEGAKENEDENIYSSVFLGTATASEDRLALDEQRKVPALRTCSLQRCLRCKLLQRRTNNEPLRQP